MPQADFLVREVPPFGRTLFRLGLSGSFGLDEAGCREALERVQYVFWSPRMKELTPALREALARDRSRYVVATGVGAQGRGGGAASPWHRRHRRPPALEDVRDRPRSARLTPRRCRRPALAERSTTTSGGVR